MEQTFVSSGPELKPLTENIFYLEKWNWDYSEALNFQLECQELVRQNPKLKILIFCSHPSCFTMGKGLQKGKKMQGIELVDWDKKFEAYLPFPLYQTKRGGGLTFHYPEQWVFYPIMKINESTWTLSHHLEWILSTVQTVLEQDFELENLDHDRAVVGIWKDQQKLASLGIGLSHFVSTHGLALNLQRNKDMFSALSKLNPCGLQSSSFSTLEDQAIGAVTPQEFQSYFMQHLRDNLPKSWKKYRDLQ